MAKQRNTFTPLPPQMHSPTHTHHPLTTTTTPSSSLSSTLIFTQNQRALIAGNMGQYLPERHPPLKYHVRHINLHDAIWMSPEIYVPCLSRVPAGSFEVLWFSVLIKTHINNLVTLNIINFTQTATNNKCTHPTIHHHFHQSPCMRVYSNAWMWSVQVCAVQRPICIVWSSHLGIGRVL